MKFNTRLTFAGLAGLAIASGAGFYFYKRRQLNKSNPQNLLLELRNAIFGPQSTQFNQIMYIFVKSYNLLLGKDLKKLQQDSLDSPEIKRRFCKKPLGEMSFYECLDCSTNIKNRNYSQQEFEDLDFYHHQICEDCFDQEIHKGHQYRLSQKIVGDGQCDCGNSYIIKESSFCSQHKGFKDLKEELENPSFDQIKQKTSYYFKELFFILVDGQSDLLHQKMKQEKIEDYKELHKDELFVQYNILITLIIDQIIEILNSNHKFVFIFAQLLQQRFEKPIRYDIYLEKYHILDEKKTNSQITILEYLLIHQTLLNEKSIEKLNNLLNIISSADSNFLEFICLKFTKLINFAIKEDISYDELGQQISVFTIKKLYATCQNAFANLQFVEKTQLENEDYVINLAKVLRNITKKMTFQIEDEFLVIQMLLSPLFDFFNTFNIIERFNRLEELLEIILESLENLFENSHVITTSPGFDIEEYFQLNFIQIGGNVLCSSQLQNYLYNLISFAHKDLNSEKKGMILKVLSKRYKSQINSIYQKSQQHKANFQKDRTYLGLSYAYLIINIVILSEGAEFSSKNVMNTFIKNFQFQDQQEIEEFISKIYYILQCNMILYSFHDIVLLFSNMSQFKQLEPLTSDEKEFLQHNLLLSQNSIYDSNTLAVQLITSIIKDRNELIFKFVNNYKKKFWLDDYSQYLNITKPKNIMLYLMFDQTPFININKKVKNILSDGKQEIQQSIEYAVQQVINNNIIWHPTKSKSYQQFIEQVTECILDKDLILSNLKLFGEFDKTKDFLNIKPLENLENVSLNIGRYFNSLQDQNLYNTQSPYLNYQVKSGVFQKIFKFQQDLIIKALINPILLIKIKEQLQCESEFLVQTSYAFDFFLFYWAILVKLSDNQPDIFSEEQIQLIIEFKTILFTSENIDFFKLKLQEIKASYSENKYPDPQCLELLDLLEEFEQRQEKQ